VGSARGPGEVATNPRPPRALYVADGKILVDQPIQREFKPVFGHAVHRRQDRSRDLAMWSVARRLRGQPRTGSRVTCDRSTTLRKRIETSGHAGRNAGQFPSSGGLGVALASRDHGDHDERQEEQSSDHDQRHRHHLHLLVCNAPTRAPQTEGHPWGRTFRIRATIAAPRESHPS
jgi:hypothetical protein